MAKVPPPTSYNYAANKRGPTTSLSGSSSEGENSDIEDIPPSPCSSTSSGPIYIRPAGFNHHAQEIQATLFQKCRSVKFKKKIKKNVAVAVADNLLCQQGIRLGIDKNNNCNNNNVRTAVPPNKIKHKPKKDPLPMKLRALPQSFWQQPNAINSVPPGSMYIVLPPVSKTYQSTIGDITDARPVTPPSDPDEKYSKPVIKTEKTERTKGAEKLQDVTRESIAETVTMEVVKPKAPKPPPRREVRVSASSPNLLAKLFDGVESGKKSTMTSSVKRGRPKRENTHPHHSKHLVGEDPYMIDAVSDGLLPLLSIESNRQSIGPGSHLSIVSVKDGDKTLTLPALNIEQNYPAMLSELVKAL